MLRVLFIITCSFCATIALAQPGQQVNTAGKIAGKDKVISLAADSPSQVKSRRDALLRQLPLLNNAFEVHDLEFSNETYIYMHQKIDQKYFNNRFKVLSKDSPILFKLFT